MGRQQASGIRRLKNDMNTGHRHLRSRVALPFLHTFHPVFLCVLCVLCGEGLCRAGDLNPPAGPVAPTHKTLTQIEPRTLIDSLPQTIAAPGSYYLARDLTGVSGQPGITITASNVTIDLNGFTLRGVAGSFYGIGSLAGANDLTVRNGGVTGWGGSGIDLANANNGLIEGVVASGNRDIGIRSGGNFVVSRCVARNNGVTTGQAGISTNGPGCVFEACASTGNGGAGIGGGSNSVIRDCIATLNSNSGISVGNGCTIAHCSATSNVQHGIAANDACHISDCVAASNGLDGIRAATGCFIMNNLCRGNGAATIGAGIHVTGADNHIEANSVTTGDFGVDVDAGGNLVIRNSASGNTTNYSLTGTNTVGPTITSATIGTSTNPHANYSY